MKNLFSFLSKSSKNIFLVVSAAFLLMFAAFGTIGLFDANAVSAQENAEFAGVEKRARPDMSAFALNFGKADAETIFAGGGIVRDEKSVVNGKIFDALREGETAENLRADLEKSFSAINQLPCQKTDSEILRGGKFSPGVYCFSAAELDAEIALDGESGQTNLFIFRIDGKISAKNTVKMSFINAARPANVYFVGKDSAKIESETAFDGNIFVKNSVETGAKAKVNGRIYALDGAVRLTETSAGAVENGVLQICKYQSGTGLENRAFHFRIGTNVYVVPVGQCSSPIVLPVGNYVIEELLTGTLLPSGSFSGRFSLTNVSSPVSGAITSVNLPQRTANISLNAPLFSEPTVINFTNKFTFTAVVEICKKPVVASADGSVNDVDVQGFFDYTIDVIPNTVFTVPVGFCSGPIQVTVVPTGNFPLPTFGYVKVTELAENGYTLESANTFPAGRFYELVLNKGINRADGTTEFDNPRGGYVRASVLEGDTSNQATINFYNRTNPSKVKVCKVAGNGIPLNTRFRFTVTGLAPSGSGTVILPGVTVSRTVDVAAGSAAQGGNCVILAEPFITGSVVTVTEQAEPLDPIPGVPANNIAVTKIRLSAPATATALNLANRTVSFRLRAEMTEVEFTNIGVQPTLLKICKIAGGGIAVGQPFTFDVTIDDNPSAYIPPVIVPAGPASQGGTCVYAQGPYTPLNTTPPIGRFAIGSTVTVTERAVTGVQVVAITSPTGTPTVNLTAKTGRLTLQYPNGFNEITFTNFAVSECYPTGCIPPVITQFDFDGDRKADVSGYVNGNWIWKRSLTGQPAPQVAFGIATDNPAPADYDGDGKTDIAVYRNGIWHILRSYDGQYRAEQFGLPDDIPVPADYDGDGKKDIALYRSSNGTWYLMRSRDGFAAVQFGISTDKPVTGDYDGDGKADVAVFRPSTGVWYQLRSRDGFSAIQFGVSGDKLVAGDYDGDGKTDVAVYRPSTGNWYLNQSRDGFRAVLFGISNDIPVPADYDGDGKTDIAVYRNGIWYISASFAGFTVENFSVGGGIPLPSVYVR